MPRVPSSSQRVLNERLLTSAWAPRSPPAPPQPWEGADWHQEAMCELLLEALRGRETPRLLTWHLAPCRGVPRHRAGAGAGWSISPRGSCSPGGHSPSRGGGRGEGRSSCLRQSTRAGNRALTVLPHVCGRGGSTTALLGAGLLRDVRHGHLVPQFPLLGTQGWAGTRGCGLRLMFIPPVLFLSP